MKKRILFAVFLSSALLLATISFAGCGKEGAASSNVPATDSGAASPITTVGSESNVATGSANGVDSVTDFSDSASSGASASVTNTNKKNSGTSSGTGTRSESGTENASSEKSSETSRSSQSAPASDTNQNANTNAATDSQTSDVTDSSVSFSLGENELPIDFFDD